MKRVLALLLALGLILSCAACSQSGKTVKSPADFEGAKIAVQDETTADDSIADMVADGVNVEVFRYPQVINCFDDLKSGRVDAVYVDNVVATYYIKDDANFERVWVSPEAEPLGICLAKGSDNLLAAIEAAVDMLYYNGTMSELARKWFGQDLSSGIRAVSEEPVIPALGDGDLITPGTLMVGADIGYPPMEYYEDGTIAIGFDIDVGAAIAGLLGLDHRVIDTAWDGIFAGVVRGDYDCIISSVSITPARLETYLLTEPYVSNELCLVVKK